MSNAKDSPEDDGSKAAQRTAFMFPGQGSQSVGMFSRLLGDRPAARARLQEAEQLLGWPLAARMEQGPEEALRDTERAQPALLTVSVACAEALREPDGGEGPPEVVLGHSVGEYAALVVGGALSFADAVRLVQARAALMGRASRAAPGGMVAVLGAPPDALADLVAEVAGPDLGVLEITNFNAPKQQVLSGQQAALDAAVALVTERRLGRAVPLPVSAPFHCALMKPLAEQFAAHLRAVTLRAPRCRFIDNVTGALEADPEAIRAKLVEQLYKPVRWEDSVHSAARLGVTRFVECGPGKVLTGLVKRIQRKAERVTAEQRLAADA